MSKGILGSVSILASTRFVEFVVGLLRVKLNALILGVKGVAIVEQVAFLAQQLATFTNFGMSEGFVKQVAEYSDKDMNAIQQNLASAIKAFFLLITFFFLLSSSLTFIFQKQITEYLFGHESYLSFFYVAFLSLPVLLFNGFCFAVLKAFKSSKYIAKARLFSCLSNLLILAPLVFSFELWGAVIYVLISYFVVLFFNAYFAYNLYLKKYKITIKLIFKANVDNHRLRELLTFSGFGITVGTALIASEFAIRAILVAALGVESLGLYSPVIMWASMFTGIILPAFSTFLYPRFCELSASGNYNPLINQAIRISTFAVMPFLLFSMPTKGFFIPLFYSSDFIGAGQFVFFHFLGVMFYAWWYIYSQLMTPSGRIKQHGVLLLFMYSINFMIVYLLVDDLGLYSYALKFLVVPILFFFGYCFYLYVAENITVSRDNITLMFYALLSSLLVFYVDENFGWNISLVFSFFLFLILFYFLTPDELGFIKKKISLVSSKVFK